MFFSCFKGLCRLYESVIDNVHRRCQTVHCEPILKETQLQVDLKLLSALHGISEQSYGSLAVSQFSFTY